MSILRTHIDESRKTPLYAVCAVALALELVSGPGTSAWADSGGNGGRSSGSGNVGAGGDTGNQGANGLRTQGGGGTGGGGGGAGAQGGRGGNGSINGVVSGAGGSRGQPGVGAGGAGQDGGNAVQAGGGGGGGGGATGNGTGTGTASIANPLATTLQGGDGGNGGEGNEDVTGNKGGGGGGGGGEGGQGALITGGGASSNAGAIIGGTGGGGGNAGTQQGSSTPDGGNGGDGGIGVHVSAPGVTLTNTGTIQGGNGGGIGTSIFANSNGSAGDGGVGIVGSDLAVINEGTVAGGLANGGAGGRANAITFTGGTNALEVRAGFSILGNVQAASAADTFLLGGAANAAFDVSGFGSQYLGFGSFTKTGASTWTLTGTTAQTTPWLIEDGILEVSSNANLGAAAGGLTFDGGTLRTTATTTMNRATTINAGGGTFETNPGTTLTQNGAISGAGDLDKTGAGTLVLTNNNSYAGATDITAGTLQIGGGGTTGTLGAGDVTVAGGANVVFDRSNSYTVANEITGAGTLIQQGSGATTLTSATNSVGDTDIDGGTLDVDGGLVTPTISMAGGTTLNVDGTVQAAGPAAAMITGDAGVNNVTVGAAGTLLAVGDLGGGADVLDVFGTLDTDGGNLDLGGGDDTILIHNGTTITGTVLGGAGFDTRIYDHAGVVNIGALLEFEGLIKRGGGELDITGPANSELVNVRVETGVLDIEAGATVVNQAGQVLDTTILTGATLNVDGDYGCAASDDTMDVFGTISGGGTIDLCAGDDGLTLNDGTALNNNISGGADTDTVTLNNANAFTFDATRTNNFEILIKQNTGVATINNNQTYSVRSEIQTGTLAVQGAITTPDFFIFGPGTLMGTGSIIGDVDNQGLIAPGNSIGTFLIVGNYAGGGNLEVEAMLGDDGFPADRLLITGNVTGVTDVDVINLGGTGAPTGLGATDGVSVIQVGGNSTAGSFVLNGYVAGGPYQYFLNAFDPASSDAGELDPLLAAEIGGGAPFWDYRLQSEGAEVPQIDAYQALPSGAFSYGAALMDSLHDSLHDPAGHCAGETKFLNGYSGHTGFNGDNSPDYSQNTWFAQGGVTPVGWTFDNDESVICGGAALSFGGIDLNVKGSSGEVDMKAPGASLTGTFRASEGWYVNAVAVANRFSTTITTAERGLVGTPNGIGAGLSVQTGLPAALVSRGLTVEPVARLSFQQIWFDKFTDVDSIETSLQGGDSLQGRIGGRIEGFFDTARWGRWEPHAGAYLIHEFFEGENIRAAGVEFPTDLGGTSLRIDVGANASLTPLTDFVVNASYEESLGKGTGDTFSGTARVRWKF